MTNELIEKAEQFITENSIKFRGGKREVFLNDLKKSVQPTHNGFRSVNGQRIDLNSYMLSMLETNLYSERPSARGKYQPIFPVRNESIKNSNKKVSEQAIRKIMQHENIIFNADTESQVIQMLSESFIVSDDEKAGIVFSRVNDTEIGCLVGKDNYTFEQLLNNSGAARWVDETATKIAKLQHRATLRKAAAEMLEVGSKPKDIEKLTDELYAFESRGLRSGMKKPYQDQTKVQEEFGKLAALKGNNRTGASTTVGIGTSPQDDLSPVKSAISKIEPPKTQNEYPF